MVLTPGARAARCEFKFKFGTFPAITGESRHCSLSLSVQPGWGLFRLGARAASGAASARDAHASACVAQRAAKEGRSEPGACTGTLRGPRAPAAAALAHVSLPGGPAAAASDRPPVSYAQGNPTPSRGDRAEATTTLLKSPVKKT